MLETTTWTLNGLIQEQSLRSRGDQILKTIANRMSLEHQLGIRYLWGDGLCIVQGDEKSKHAQAQAMAGLYANAYITLWKGLVGTQTSNYSVLVPSDSLYGTSHILSVEREQRVKSRRPNVLVCKEFKEWQRNAISLVSKFDLEEQLCETP